MKISILILLALATIIGLLFLGPIPQDQLYYQFADSRTLLNIPNALNVLSNLAFLGIAGIGFWQLKLHSPATSVVLYSKLFTFGVLLTAFGSAWFHLLPSNASLVWDRLPMTIAFSTFFVCILQDYVTERSKALFWPVLLFSISSVFFWYWTEQIGKGDLRPYILVQFLPILLLPFILIMYKPRYTRVFPLLIALILYVLAKISEAKDMEIYELTNQWLSGHSLKHILAAIGAYYIIKACLGSTAFTQNHVATNETINHKIVKPKASYD